MIRKIIETHSFTIESESYKSGLPIPFVFLLPLDKKYKETIYRGFRIKLNGFYKSTVIRFLF
jgi:hypothetical protein